MLLKERFSAKKTALIGVLAAIAVIAAYLESILPVSKLSLIALASFLVSIIVIEAGIRAGILFYVVTSLLIFIVIPKKTSLIPYVLFFGYYGIVKYYIEKIRKIVPEIILKLLFFNICFYIIYYVLNFIFLPDIKLPVYIIALAMQLVFLVYDYVYSQIIHNYNSRIRSKLRLGN
jgi:hypothetical protein